MTDLAEVPDTDPDIRAADDAFIAGFPRADLAALAENFTALMRTFTRLRARWLAAAEHDVEWSAHVLLKAVQNEAPVRAGALAEAMQFDPSTVSRQVAALVKDGLLERRADPADGRASLLVLTPRAEAILEDHEDVRLQHFATMLGDWSGEDVADLAGLLGRFAEAYAAVAPEQLERFTTRSTH